MHFFCVLYNHFHFIILVFDLTCLPQNSKNFQYYFVFSKVIVHNIVT